MHCTCSFRLSHQVKTLAEVRTKFTIRFMFYSHHLQNIKDTLNINPSLSAQMELQRHTMMSCTALYECFTMLLLAIAMVFHNQLQISQPTSDPLCQGSVKECAYLRGVCNFRTSSSEHLQTRKPLLSTFQHQPPADRG